LIVKSLRLENIRSYKRAEIVFPQGKTLFVGDIGSGKSTILMAVEFALFGLGSSTPSSLLRVGEGSGKVELVFEAGGREYLVSRTLARKGPSIQQTEGRLEGGQGGVEDYSASELKERILDILKFRESPEPKSKSLIYEYAVYTPQEEMKQIISISPDLRLQILRRTFGADEYKQAMENAKEVRAKIRDKRVELQAGSADVSALREEMEGLEARAKRGERELAELEAEEQRLEVSLRQSEKQMAALHEVREQLGSARSDKKHLARQIEEARHELEETAAEAETLEKKAERLEERIAKVGAPPTLKTQKELNDSRRTLRKEIDKHAAFGVEVETKIGQYESVAEKRKCPVCDREADSREFADKVSRLEADGKTNSAHLKRLNAELEEVEILIDSRKNYDSAVEQKQEDAATAKECLEDARRKKVRCDVIRGGLKTSQKALSELESRVAVLEEEAAGLEPLQRSIESSREKLRSVRDEVSGLRADIKNWKLDVRKHAESISRKERMSSRATQLREREIWLDEFFVPTLETIERSVMLSINREFDSDFQRWFGMLVEDAGKESRVDEDFTPLVAQDGYEQDVDFLSGGERTSVALAYRLALSRIVQKFSTEGGPNALILDEPTDGFSKEQLGKMREILDEMANPQVIIVSHERELESFADQIYRVSRVNGESRITQ